VVLARIPISKNLLEVKSGVLSLVLSPVEGSSKGRLWVNSGHSTITSRHQLYHKR